MLRCDQFPEAGITVVRGAIEPVLVASLYEDCDSLIDRAFKFETYQATKSEESEGGVFTQAHLSLARFEALGLLGICSVIKRINSLDIDDFEIGIPQDSSFAVNLQEPNAAQKFHPDRGKRPPVLTIHASDDGAFDYVTRSGVTEEEAELDHKSLEDIRAGDVVVQNRPGLLHRGRNRGSGYRLSLSSYVPGS